MENEKPYLGLSRARAHKPEASKQTNERTNKPTNEWTNYLLSRSSRMLFHFPFAPCSFVGFFFFIRMTQKCIHISVGKVSRFGKSKHTDSQIRTHNNFSTFVIFREREREGGENEYVYWLRKTSIKNWQLSRTETCHRKSKSERERERKFIVIINHWCESLNLLARLLSRTHPLTSFLLLLNFHSALSLQNCVQCSYKRLFAERDTRIAHSTIWYLCRPDKVESCKQNNRNEKTHQTNKQTNIS